MDELLLLSGNDLPFPEARLTIHNPILKEIAYITQTRFWPACQLLKFDKEILAAQDKVDLSNRSNFNIIMTMMQQRSLQAQQAKLGVLSLLSLLFPTNKIIFGRQAIQIQNPQTGEVSEINDSNFDKFKSILIDMFCLKAAEQQYNPSGELAKKIADKIKRGQQKKAKLAPQGKIAILSRYISILSVGMQKSPSYFMNCTVYQLMDVFTRYQLKLHYDAWERYRIAGATELEDPQDWLKDIYSNDDKKQQIDDQFLI